LAARFALSAPAPRFNARRRAPSATGPGKVVAGDVNLDGSGKALVAELIDAALEEQQLDCIRPVRWAAPQLARPRA
jgi:hypothetical protein